MGESKATENAQAAPQHEPASALTDEALIGTGPAMIEQLAESGRLTPQSAADVIVRRPQDRSAIVTALQQKQGNQFWQEVRKVLEGGPKRTAEDEAKLVPEDRQHLDDVLHDTENSFVWLNDAAQHHLDQLRHDLQREDAPSMSERVMETILEVGLGAGAAGAGVFLAGKVLAVGVGAATHELVKVSFEQGMDAGVAAGRAKLAGSSHAERVDVFIDSQKDGVRAMHHANQIAFINDGRHRVEENDVKGLEEGLTLENVQAAAESQRSASRDAWVTQLAQSKFGTVGAHGASQSGDVNSEPPTTNMSTAKQRARANASAPGYEPADAPNVNDAILGRAPGVLEVVATLPAISEDHAMAGEPRVRLALLNGVNDVIRDEIATQCKVSGLGGVHVPRQIVATVEGGEDFTLSLDENGTPTGITYAQAEWLRRRAVVGHPENAGKSGPERERIGLALLLRSLAPDEIRGKLL